MSSPHEQLPVSPEPVRVPPYELTDAQRTVVGTAYEYVLTPLHEQQKVLEGILPPDHPTFPNEKLTIFPNERLSIGNGNFAVWDVETSDGFSAQVTAERIAGQEKPDFRMRMPSENGSYQRADEQTATTIVGLLHGVLGNVESPPRALTGRGHRQRHTNRHLGSLIQRWLNGAS